MSAIELQRLPERGAAGIVQSESQEFVGGAPTERHQQASRLQGARVSVVPVMAL